MHIHKKLVKAGRRGFLRKTALMGGSVVVGSNIAGASEPEIGSIQAEAVANKGYEKTEHVQSYYKRARF